MTPKLASTHFSIRSSHIFKRFCLHQSVFIQGLNKRLFVDVRCLALNLTLHHNIICLRPYLFVKFAAASFKYKFGNGEILTL